MASTAAAALRRCACPGALLATVQRGAPGRAQRALYGGRQIGVGNSVSFSEHKYAHPEHGHARGPHSPVPLRPRPRLTHAGCQFEFSAALTRVHGYLCARFGPAGSLPFQNTTNVEAERADEATVERRLWYNAAPPRHNARPALH